MTQGGFKAYIDGGACNRNCQSEGHGTAIFGIGRVGGAAIDLIALARQVGQGKDSAGVLFLWSVHCMDFTQTLSHTTVAGQVGFADPGTYCSRLKTARRW